MKSAYVPALFLGLLVLVLLALMWPLTRRSTAQYRIQSIEPSVELAKDIESLQASASQDLERARALLAAAQERRTPVTVPQADPFALQMEELATVAGVQLRPSTAAVPEESALTEIGVEDLQIFHKEDEWPALALSGIVLSAKEPLAIINSDVHKLGSIVEGLQVAEITKGQVTLLSPQGERRVLLLEGWEQPKEGE